MLSDTILFTNENVYTIIPITGDYRCTYSGKGHIAKKLTISSLALVKCTYYKLGAIAISIIWFAVRNNYGVQTSNRE